MIMALPPPNYEDAILFPVSSSSCGDILGEAAAASALHAHKDVLPSYDTACASADRFQLTVSPASSPRKADGGVSRSSGEGVSSSTPPSVSEPSFSSSVTAVCTAPCVPSSSSYSSASANDAGHGSCHQSLVGDLGRGTGHVHDVAILVTRSQETEERQTSSPTSSLLCAGDSAASSQRTRDSQCSSAQSSQRSCIVTDIDMAAQTMHGTCSASVQGPRPVSAADSEGIGSGAFCYRAGQDTLPRPRSDDLGRRTSDGWQRAQPTTGKRASRDLTLSGLGPRTQRSCSDAVVHAASRTRAAAAAAAAMGTSSNLMCAHPHSHQHPHQHGGEQSRVCSHQHHHQYHRSHSCIPQHLEVADNSGIPNGDTGIGRRAHSHTSIARLGVTGHRGHREHGSNSSLSRGEEAEVSYVWKDGRVQVHHARSGTTMPDLSVSGQHVHYMWKNGNVQRVVRGSNHELLSSEIVPPRGEVKGINYCVVFSVMAFFVFLIAALIFIFRVIH